MRRRQEGRRVRDANFCISTAQIDTQLYLMSSVSYVLMYIVGNNLIALELFKKNELIKEFYLQYIWLDICYKIYTH